MPAARRGCAWWPAHRTRSRCRSAARCRRPAPRRSCGESRDRRQRRIGERVTPGAVPGDGDDLVLGERADADHSDALHRPRQLATRLPAMSGNDSLARRLTAGQGRSMRAVVITEPGEPEVLRVDDRARSGAEAGRGSGRGGGDRGQPGRPAAAAGQLPAAARRVGVPRHGVLRHDRGAGRGRRRLERGRRRSARCSAGGGYAELRRGAGRPADARARRGLRWSTRRRCPRSPARCGRWSSAPTPAGCSPARGCWSTADRAASARWPSSSRTPAAPRVRHRGHRRARWSSAASSAPTSAINYRDEDFVERVLAETDRDGVDVVLDNMGGSYLPRNIAARSPPAAG